MTMFAQTLGEYGAIASIGAAARELAYSIGSWFRSESQTAWMIAAAIIFLWLVLRRRRLR
jgi:hypothetical protein